MIFIGIDNGVTGTITALSSNNPGVPLLFTPMPVKIEQSYTKSVKNINRVDFPALVELLGKIANPENIFVVIERPMVNPGRFGATVSALRALEATLIAVEQLDLPYRYIDSREWQKAMLPRGLWKEKLTKTGKIQLVSPGSAVLKKAAVDIARRKWPQLKMKDADSLLIAEYARTHRDKF